ncbi:MAG: DUF998 domain-containing protein [Microgenomates group bacterium]
MLKSFEPLSELNDSNAIFQKEMSYKILGLAGIAGVSIYFIIFIFLGLVQPGYNHFHDTVSALVLGEFGFIQTINFIILASSFFFVGLGVGGSMYKHKINQVSLTFILFAFVLLIAAIFPTNDLRHPSDFPASSPSLGGVIHFFGSLSLVLCAPLMLYSLFRGMRQSKYWKSLIPYTAVVLIISFVFGGVWFLLLDNVLFFAWKGFFQKLLITNVLIWMGVLSWKIVKKRSDY